MEELNADPIILLSLFLMPQGLVSIGSHQFLIITWLVSFVAKGPNIFVEIQGKANASGHFQGHTKQGRPSMLWGGPPSRIEHTIRPRVGIRRKGGDLEGPSRRRDRGELTPHGDKLLDIIADDLFWVSYCR